MSTPNAPIAIYYEHPHWFQPLFDELDRRGLPYDAVRADRLVSDPSSPWPGQHQVVLNRMSPSAWTRGSAGAVFFTGKILQHLESTGAEVWNGAHAWDLDTSKATQQRLVEKLGLKTPKTRIVLSVEQLVEASLDLTFPLLVKPNIGGTGAGIERVDDLTELQAKVADGSLVTGPDGVFLLQEYHAPKDNTVVRVETLGGRFLYAIKTHLEETPTTFNLCPAEASCTLDGRTLTPKAAGLDNGARVAAFEPSDEVIQEVEDIVQAGGIDVGGVEYLVSQRDGQRYYYDVNALSNFVADPMTVLGFDPTARLVDALETRLMAAAA